MWVLLVFFFLNICRPVRPSVFENGQFFTMNILYWKGHPYFRSHSRGGGVAEHGFSRRGSGMQVAATYYLGDSQRMHEHEISEGVVTYTPSQ